MQPMSREPYINQMHDVGLALIVDIIDKAEFTTIESKLYAMGIHAYANSHLDYYKSKQLEPIGRDLKICQLLRHLVQGLSFYEEPITTARKEMLALLQTWETHCYTEIRQLQDGNMGYED